MLHKWSDCFISQLYTAINFLFSQRPIKGRYIKWAASNYECLKQLGMLARSNLLHHPNSIAIYLCGHHSENKDISEDSV